MAATNWLEEHLAHIEKTLESTQKTLLELSQQNCQNRDTLEKLIANVWAREDLFAQRMRARTALKQQRRKPSQPQQNRPLPYADDTDTDSDVELITTGESKQASAAAGPARVTIDSAFRAQPWPLKVKQVLEMLVSHDFELGRHQDFVAEVARVEAALEDTRRGAFAGLPAKRGTSTHLSVECARKLVADLYKVGEAVSTHRLHTVVKAQVGSLIDRVKAALERWRRHIEAVAAAEPSEEVAAPARKRLKRGGH